MNAIHHKAFCKECGRKILVILLSIGTPHQYVDSVLCAECFSKKGGVDEQWAKDNPVEAKELAEWIKTPYVKIYDITKEISR